MRKVVCLLALGALFLFPTIASAECGLCGDLTGDGNINMLDITAFIDWYYGQGNPLPNCPDDADVNCDNAVTVGGSNSDLGIIIDYLYHYGPAPCDPVAFPACAGE
ncbi:MAG: hypothetical protein R3F48_09925 [Candidatus Zixiibacteriota bacterium]